MPPPHTSANCAAREGKLLELQRLLKREGLAQEATQIAAASSWRRLVGSGRLIDCLVQPGSGGGLVALDLCNQAVRQGGEFVVVDPQGTFFPPAAVAWGVDASRMLVVNPPHAAEALAAVETALRSPAVAAVWALLGAIDARAFRRLLLASEVGRAVGALVRPANHEPQPSWGDVQLRFSAVPSAGDDQSPFRVRVTQTRNRHGPAGGEALLAIDWKTAAIKELHREAHAQPAPTNTRRLAAGLARAARPA